MTVIDPNSVAAVQAELIQGENILWAGKPSSSVVFHGEDLFLIPFSLLWGGFALFWEAGAAGLWGAGSQQGGQWVFGIPFFVIGQYLIWGRFFYVAWKKKRTHYAITTQRVLVVQNTWRHWMVSAYIGALPAVSKNEHKKVSGH